MLMRPLGSSSLEASVIGLGTWAIGGEGWGGTDEDASIAAIQASIEAGANLIDTAPVYGFGLSEEIVGKALKGRRNKVILATKCGLVWDTTHGNFFFPTATGAVHKYLGPESIERELEASLRRLQTDTIDLYQTHWQETTTPISDTMSILLKLQQQGKIRAIGVSNVNPAQLNEYQRYGSIASAQEIYSMVDREHEAALFPACAKSGVSVLAYSPLAMGLLTGTMSAERSFAPGDMRAGNPRFAPEVLKAVNAFLDKIRPLAEAREVSLSQLVIAWSFHQPGVTHVLCGARNPRQAIQNAEAGRLHLSVDELALITSHLDAAALKVPKVFG